MRDPNGTHIPEPSTSAHHWPNAVDFGELAAFADDIEGMGPNDVASRRASPAFSRGEDLARAESDALGWQLRNALEVLAEVRAASGAPKGASLIAHVRKCAAYGGKLSELRQILDVQQGDALIPTAIVRMRQLEGLRHDQATPERRQLAIIAALKNDLAAARAKLEEQTAKTEAMATAAFTIVDRLVDEGATFDRFLDNLGAVFQVLDAADAEQADKIRRMFYMAIEAAEPSEPNDEPTTRNGTDSVFG